MHVAHEEQCRELLKKYQELVNTKGADTDKQGPRLFSKVANAREIRLHDQGCSYANFRECIFKKKERNLKKYQPKKNKSASRSGSGRKTKEADTAKKVDYLADDFVDKLLAEFVSKVDSAFDPE